MRTQALLDAAEDVLAYQTMSGEAQHDFAWRAQLLGANAWRAVDLGTGPGEAAVALARALPGLHLIAIELSPPMLRLARRKRGMVNVSFVHGDATATGLDAGSCDLVLAHDLAHHLSEPLALFVEVARLAGDDAAICIRDLQRPDTPEARERVVDAHAQEWSDRQRQLLRDALGAALRIDEVQALCDVAGLVGALVRPCGEYRWEVARARLGPNV